MASSSSVPSAYKGSKKPLSFVEFVLMMAASMATYALAIDAMLPALPSIGHSFRVSDDNQLQWVVMLYVVGGGIGQIFYGPLSDWLGRRPVLLLGLLLYMSFGLMASFATSLPMLLGFRVLQGLAGASASVIPKSIIRDRYSGPRMAKVSSITFIVFLIVPVMAPTVGQALLLAMEWRGIFGFLGLFGLAVAVWVILRLPESIHPSHRRFPSITHLVRAGKMVLGEPSSIFYSLAITCMVGSLMAYISTVPQIFADYFHQPTLMPTIFALCAGTMAASSFFNVRIVERVGMRRVSHGAVCAFTCFSLIHSLVALSGQESLVTFTLLQALTMGCFGLATSNFNAIAMHHMGHIAGSAASVQGIITMIGGAMVGSLIGHQWHGQVTFLPIGSFCCGILALGCILLAERGKMFNKPPSDQVES